MRCDLHREDDTNPSFKAMCAEVSCLACHGGKQRDGCLCLLSGQNALEDTVKCFREGFTVWFAQESLGRLYLILITVISRP